MVTYLSRCPSKAVISLNTALLQVEAKKEVVEADEKVANEAAAESKAIKDECEADLAEALPALKAAIKALNTLKPSVRLVKSLNFKRPGDVTNSKILAQQILNP